MQDARQQRSKIESNADQTLSTAGYITNEKQTL